MKTKNKKYNLVYVWHHPMTNEYYVFTRLNFKSRHSASQAARAAKYKYSVIVPYDSDFTPHYSIKNFKKALEIVKQYEN